MIDNKDKLCLPRAIVVGRAYIQHFHEKSVSKHEYYCIAGIKKSQVDRQGELAKELCAHAGIRVEEHGSKTFGMEEVKLFAQLLAPKYGIAVHNSLTANSRVFETSTSEDQKIVSWINLLNLNDHFNAMIITKPSGFFGTHYWCELCNKCYADKQKHKCIPNCVACKTLNTENCNFKHGKKQRTVMPVTETFYGEAWFQKSQDYRR